MPLAVAPRRRRAGLARGDLDGEGRRAHCPSVAEVEEKAVGAGRRSLDGEGHLARAGPTLEGVHVEVGQVGRPDGNEVAQGAEIGIQVGHGLTIP